MILIFLIIFIYLLGFGIIIPIIPILSRDFGATALQAGLLMSCYSLMQFLFAPFWGRLSDRKGRRPILVFCLLGESLCYVLFAYAKNLETLFLARLLAGFFGASISTASAYISDITPPQERSKGMALIGVAFGLGFMLGPAIGGGLAVWAHSLSSELFFDTKFVALWVAALCLANFLFSLRYLKESLQTVSLRPRPNRWNLILEKISVKTVGQLIGIFFLLSFAMSSMEATLVLFMKDQFSWGIREVSFGFAYIGIILILTQGVIVRRLIPLIGERKTLLTGLVFFSLGFLGIVLSPNIFFMALTMTSLAIGNGLCNPSTLGSISLLTSSDEQGSTLGVTQSLSSLGRILGPALGGLFYDRLAKAAPFLVSFLLVLIACFILFFIYQNIPESGKKSHA